LAEAKLAVPRRRHGVVERPRVRRGEHRTGCRHDQHARPRRRRRRDAHSALRAWRGTRVVGTVPLGRSSRRDLRAEVVALTELARPAPRAAVNNIDG
jgi:hypothetical protein